MVPVKTPAEMVTLASIVEKETGRADERPRVAGVFVNRLNRRMKLQSDPTIVYGLVGGRGTLGRGGLRGGGGILVRLRRVVLAGGAGGGQEQAGHAQRHQGQEATAATRRRGLGGLERTHAPHPSGGSWASPRDPPGAPCQPMRSNSRSTASEDASKGSFAAIACSGWSVSLSVVQSTA